MLEEGMSQEVVWSARYHPGWALCFLQGRSRHDICLKKPVAKEQQESCVFCFVFPVLGEMPAIMSNPDEGMCSEAKLSKY